MARRCARAAYRYRSNRDPGCRRAGDVRQRPRDHEGTDFAELGEPHSPSSIADPVDAPCRQRGRLVAGDPPGPLSGPGSFATTAIDA